MADPTSCEDLATEVYNLSADLRCASYGDDHTGYYNNENPLWEKRGNPTCTVQETLAKKLFFDRDLAAIDGEPPLVKKKGGNVKGGAAQDLLGGNRDAAYLKLEEFLYDLDRARDNGAWDATAANSKPESYFVSTAEGIRDDIYSCN